MYCYNLHMKNVKIFLFIVFFSILPNFSYSQSMLPLENYLKEQKNHLDDPTVLLYISERCSALFSYMSIISDTRPGPETKKLSNEAKNISEKLLLTAYNILKEKFNKSSKDAMDMVKTGLTKKARDYLNDGKNLHSKTGSYFSGYIKGDLDVCKEIFKKALN